MFWRQLKFLTLVGLVIQLTACRDSVSSKNVSFRTNGQDVVITTEVVGPGISWQRKVVEVALPERHFEIEDSFTNEGSEVAGLKVNHFLKSNYSETWLGGQKFLAIKNLNVKKSPIDFSDPWNPTVYTKIAGGAGIGLVAEDDVFRQQVHVYYDPIHKKSGLKSEMLCLGPKSSYKVSWSIYETRGDYWDFINALRSDWGASQLIEGSFIWFQPDDILAMDPAFLKERLHFQGVRTANMFGGWVDPRQVLESGEKPLLGFGTSVLSPSFTDYRSRIALAVKKLKFADPQINVLLYFDAQRESGPQADQIFKDSLFRGGNKKIESTSWSGQYSQTWSVYPTLANAYGKKLNEVVALVKELGADGLYWDEMESLDYSGVRFTSNEWDGHSCLLDSQANVLSKVGYTNLLSEEAKISYAKKARMIFANSPPTTRFFSRRPDLHMVEGQHLSDYSSYAHLTTPLAYIGSSPKWEQIIAPIANGLLPTGVRLDYNTTFFSHLYPILPLEIHPGAVWGENKIVASKNGTYGWLGNCREVKILQFNSQGQIIAANSTLPNAAQPCVTSTHLKQDEAIIIERVGLTEQPRSKRPVFFHQGAH